MAYILGLFLILAVIFSSMGGGSNMIGNFLGQAKDKVSQTLFPKTAREILIDNISSDYQDMDKFFSETAPALLNSKTLSSTDKATIQKAVEAFNGSKSLIENLSQLEQNDKGIVESLIDKVLNLNATPQPDPTNIPPQCKLVCPSQ
ncbi:MAG: hypothetical protein AAB768_00810 [Patescibacteria group bacterium]